MWTTITFKQDVAAAIERLRRERSIGVSEAVNDLIRMGLRAKSQRPTYTARSQPIGLRIDVTNVAEALEQLEEPTAR
jgi:predicted transcriptional regulator